MDGHHHLPGSSSTQKSVVTHAITLISGLLIPLVALLDEDETVMCIFNSGSDSSKDVVDKEQKLLND